MGNFLLLLLTQAGNAAGPPSSNLATYSQWGIIVALAGVVAALARAYVKARDDKDQAVKDAVAAGELKVKEARDAHQHKLEDLNKQLVDVVANYSEAASLQKSSNYQLSDALKQFAQRLEKLEDKIK